MTPLLKAECFEFYVREMAKELRSRFEQIDIGHLDFQVHVSGRTGSGDLLVEFKIGDSTYGDRVTGGAVEAIFFEFLRRKGWTEQNAALCLPRVEDRPSNDEEVF